MATISQRVFVVDATKKCIRLANEEWIRPLGIGSGWNRLRIGVLVAINPDGTNNLNGCEGMIGLCSGTNGFGSASTTNWLGLSLASQNTPYPQETFTYTAGSGNPYFSSPGTGTYKKVGSTVTYLAGSAAGYYPTTGGAIQRRALFGVDIARGNPNYATASIRLLVGQVVADFSTVDLVDMLEQSSVSSVTVRGNGLACTTMTGAFTEAAGPLNAVSIYWNKALYPLEVYSIGVYRYA